MNLILSEYMFYKKMKFSKHSYICYHIYTQTKVKQQETCFEDKKLFRTKILEIQVLLSSFDFIRIEYQCN